MTATLDSSNYTLDGLSSPNDNIHTVILSTTPTIPHSCKNIIQRMWLDKVSAYDQPILLLTDDGDDKYVVKVNKTTEQISPKPYIIIDVRSKNMNCIPGNSIDQLLNESIKLPSTDRQSLSDTTTIGDDIIPAYITAIPPSDEVVTSSGEIMLDLDILNDLPSSNLINRYHRYR